MWYLSQGFNSVEINASFYRFPYQSWIKTWLAAPAYFTFSIKVHRLVTHLHRLKGDSFNVWERFREPFSPLEDKIDFWLFQMPPGFKYSRENLDTLGRFFKKANLGNRAVVEFRDPGWWDAIEQVAETGAVFCSVSAPRLPRDIVATNGTVYMRLHGAKEWYTYVYSKKDLDTILSEIEKLEADRKAVFLNNDIGMLENGRYLLKKALRLKFHKNTPAARG
jgi:uncharacterized protein YecE (DUF72 family)